MTEIIEATWTFFPKDGETPVKQPQRTSRSASANLMHEDEASSIAGVDSTQTDRRPGETHASVEVVQHVRQREPAGNHFVDGKPLFSARFLGLISGSPGFGRKLRPQARGRVSSVSVMCR